jgi:hypothetical protein
VRYNELEEWQKDNQFIHGWYRAPLYSFKNCFRSCFRWHNETINIWVPYATFSITFLTFWRHTSCRQCSLLFFLWRTPPCLQRVLSTSSRKSKSLDFLVWDQNELNFPQYKIGVVHLIGSFLRLAMSLPFGTVSYFNCALEKNSIDLQSARLLRDNSLDHG